LAGPGEPGELAGEAAARAAFVRLASPAGLSPATRRPVRHRRSRRSRRLTSSRAELAVTLIAAAAGVSILAAYADALPTPVQKLAHVAVRAPAPHHAGLPSLDGKPSPAGSGPAGSPSRSAPPSHPAAGTTAPASQPGSPTPRFAFVTLPPTYLGTSPTCGPAQGKSQVPPVQASASPGSPYWWQAIACGGLPVVSTRPAAEPTPTPHI
jgi:hypothetical protein